MSGLSAIFKAIQALKAPAIQTERAVERARLLPTLIDTERYAPPAIARSTLSLPAAQRGFSESLVSTRPPVASFLMRPSEFLEQQPPLRSPSQLPRLEKSIDSQGLKDLPLLWAEEFPDAVRAQAEGSHRMTALKNLYGDDPVLMNLIQGDRFSLQPSPGPWYPHPITQHEGPSTLSPLELLRQLNISPLWMKGD